MAMNDNSSRSRRPCPIATRFDPSIIDILVRPKRGLRYGTDQSICGNEEIWNADTDLAVVAYGARVERQESIFVYVSRDGFACGRMIFQKSRLAFEDCFDQLVGKIIRNIGSPDSKVV